MDASLIVTTYNWPEALELTLKSIAQQSKMPAEVIVADDGSGPATTAVVAAWRRNLQVPLRHVWQEDRGFRLARSRNAALAIARGDYIVLVDGDMVLHPRFIEDHMHCARPDCFIQGARPQLSPAASARLLETGSVSAGAFTPGVARRAYALRSALLSRLTSKVKDTLGGIQGCNQSFWKHHALAVNGYDERFDAWGPEDREFAARLLHLGVRRFYVRHLAIALHLYHATRAPAGDNPLDGLLRDTLARRAVWCERGVSAHSAARVDGYAPTGG
jgi:glycosyltransferase involved in cell wall biosynthesis